MMRENDEDQLQHGASQQNVRGGLKRGATEATKEEPGACAAFFIDTQTII
jgi:hypothetical protein